MIPSDTFLAFMGLRAEDIPRMTFDELQRLGTYGASLHTLDPACRTHPFWATTRTPVEDPALVSTAGAIAAIFNGLTILAGLIVIVVCWKNIQRDPAEMRWAQHDLEHTLAILRDAALITLTIAYLIVHF